MTVGKKFRDAEGRLIEGSEGPGQVGEQLCHPRRKGDEGERGSPLTSSFNGGWNFCRRIDSPSGAAAPSVPAGATDIEANRGQQRTRL